MAYTQHVLTSGTSPGPGYPNYGQGGGVRVAYLKYTPPAYNYKVPAIIYGHGIDHVGPSPTSLSDFSTSSIIANKGVFLQVKNAGQDLPEFTRPGSNYKFRPLMLAPQVGSQFSTVPFLYCAEMIKLIYSSLQDIVDVNQIHYWGYSYGGGAGLSFSKDAFINERLASLTVIAPGYNASPNYTYVADSGLPIFMYHDVPDALAAISITDLYQSNHNSLTRNPVCPSNQIRWSGATPGTENHDTILPTMCATSVAGEQYEMSNGQMWVRDIPHYERISLCRLPRLRRA